MSIIIGADLVPTPSNQVLFQTGDIQALLGDELVEVLREADYRIVNLETPLCDTLSPITKVGGNLSAPSACVEGIKKIGVDLVGIANNHIMDQGKKGLADTIKILTEAGILFVGAGDNLEVASQPVFFEVNRKRVGIYACAEHEFSIATEYSPGANPVDHLNISDHIVQCRAKCDYLIVLYHGGKEYYRYPSPKLQKICRKIVEKGADLVICQHSHCLGSYEDYLNGSIVYGQGNFIFDDGEDEYLQTSVLIKISDDWSLDYIPIKKEGNGVRLAVNSQGEKILSEFKERSLAITQKGFIEEEYERFADKYRQFYLLKLHGRKMKSKWFRVLNRLLFRKLEPMVLNNSYTAQEKLELENYIECEAHRELLITGIKHKIEE